MNKKSVKKNRKGILAIGALTITLGDCIIPIS